MLCVGVDIGGTFTDFVVFDGRTLRTHKVLTTPDDPGRGLLQGLRELGVRAGDIVHGSTVATNAFLERKGADVTLFITKGFRDLVEIGRQARGKLYDLDWERPTPLYRRVVEVDERIAADGRVLIPIRFRRARCKSAAVCLLNSYRNSKHERFVQRRLVADHVSASAEVVPEYREYERFATTVINAYVAPVMERYLSRLQKELPAFRVRMMASNGGSVTLKAARRKPVSTLLSGPSAGVVATAALMDAIGEKKCVSFDMGGTSTDVSLLDGGMRLTKEGSVGGMPVRVAMTEIHTVGAGGGSVAWFDSGGVLRVGPRSQGADPGPACYGRGGRLATVTDANLSLGRIDPDLFFGGRLRLDVAAAKKAVGRLADAMVAVVNSNMERAIRTISVERGFDPAEFSLVAFGGAGPLHACELAKSLGMKRVIVPWKPGNFCALGALLSDIVKEKSRTVLGGAVDFRPLEEECRRELREEGLAGHRTRWRRRVELRYRGQSYELILEWGNDLHRRFDAAHRRRYGFAMPDRPVEIVTIVVRAEVRRYRPSLPKVSRRRLRVTGSVERHRLGCGSIVRGPAVLHEDNATTYVPRGFEGEIDRFGNILLYG